MEHLTDIQLIESFDGDEAPIRAHLDVCELCNERYEQLRRDWELLGTWQVDPSERDIIDRVVSAAEQERFSSTQSGIRSYLAGILKAAAMIGLAVLVGHALGRRETPLVEPQAHVPPAESSYVTALAMDFSSGLTLSALEEPLGEEGYRE